MRPRQRLCGRRGARKGGEGEAEEPRRGAQRRRGGRGGSAAPRSAEREGREGRSSCAEERGK
eukprot:2442097-Rhodomonas_salina.1